MSKRYIYYVVGYGGCGCCFYYPPAAESATFEARGGRGRRDYDESRESVVALRQLLEKATQLGNKAEVYSCWDGDYESESETRIEVGLDYFGGDEFNFNEKELITIAPSIDAEGEE